MFDKLRANDVLGRGKRVAGSNTSPPEDQPAIEAGYRLLAIVVGPMMPTVVDVTGPGEYSLVWASQQAGAFEKMELYFFPDHEFGIPRELVNRGMPIVLSSGPCVGCGTGDYTQAALRDHPSLPNGSLVPLCENCEPVVF